MDCLGLARSESQQLKALADETPLEHSVRVLQQFAEENVGFGLILDPSSQTCCRTLLQGRKVCSRSRGRPESL